MQNFSDFSFTNLICVIWKVDFVENLCRFMLNCLYLDLVRWILSLTMSKKRGARDSLSTKQSTELEIACQSECWNDITDQSQA